MPRPLLSSPAPYGLISTFLMKSGNKDIKKNGQKLRIDDRFLFHDVVFKKSRSIHLSVESMPRLSHLDLRIAQGI